MICILINKRILPGIFDIYCGLNVLNGGSHHTFNPKLLIHLKCHLWQYSYLSINQSDKRKRALMKAECVLLWLLNSGRQCPLLPVCHLALHHPSIVVRLFANPLFVCKSNKHWSVPKENIRDAALSAGGAERSGKTGRRCRQEAAWSVKRGHWEVNLPYLLHP